MALFGQEVIPFSITNVTTADWSMGHRFLGGKWHLTNAKDYEEFMLEQKVIVDPVKRKNMIVRTIKKHRRSKGLGHSSR